MPAYHPYTPHELETILDAANSNMHPSELEKKLKGRTAGGVGQMLQDFSAEDPVKWDSSIVRKYATRLRYWSDHGRQEIQQEHSRSDEEKKIARSKHNRNYAAQNQGKWKEFADYLTGLVDKHYGTRRQAAGALEISPSALAHYMSGDRKQGEPFLLKVSEVFKIPYETVKRYAG